MSLSAGTRLGPYEIAGAVGEGGMGAVYRARDTRLDRTVAIKVLHAETHADRAARERLAREARAISALTHPHICTLYDVGTDGDIDFLVMEYVDGETLAARLARGPLSADQAISFAAQIASALDRAHTAGIVHRDLKPANVMVTRTGVKLLDFGLAKPAPLISTDGRTLGASDVTQSGVIVGTVQYMAPEQLEGRVIDARTDVFAFGALLFEMLSGRKAFDGPSAASVIASILERQPPSLSAVQPLTPPGVERIVSSCLEKDPNERWQTARDLLRALELCRHVQGAPAVAGASSVPSARVSSRSGLLLAGLGGAAAALALAALAWSVGRTPATTSMPDVRFQILAEHGSEFIAAPATVAAPEFALSPDGTLLAFVASSGGRAMLWVRPLAALHARVLPGTEEATYPFWSPSSDSLGFFAQGRVKVVSLAGGAPVVRGEASRDPRGGTWAANGVFLATLMSNSAIMSMSPQGVVSPTVPVNADVGENNHRWPIMLPDGRHYLYAVRSANPARRGVTLAAVGEKAGTHLVDSDHAAAFADGNLLFVRGRSLMAQPLDLEQRRLTGEARIVVDDVAANTTGHAAFSVAGRTLAFARTWPVQGELTWYTRSGQVLGPPLAPLSDSTSFVFSPDYDRLAVSITDPQTGTPDLWMLDLRRAGLRERLTFDRMTDANAFWSPDGSQVVFRSNRSGINRIYIKRINDSRSEELLRLGVQDDDLANMILTDYSADGRHIILTNTGRATSFDVWRIRLLPTPEAFPVIKSEFDEYQAVISPDSRWLAYVSNETGRPEVYVQAFPDGGQRYQISSAGGTEPHWRADGRELFFIGMDRSLMAVPVTTGTTFQSGVPAALMRVAVPTMANPYRRQYAPSRDGQRFLINRAPEGVPPSINVVLDWRALPEGRP